MNKENSGHSQQRREDPQSQQDQVDLIKRAVRDTFHAMREIEDGINKLQRVRASLKHDLIDLKDGRIDKIEQRQEIDDISKEHGVFTVSKKIEIGAKGNNSQWYIPYLFHFKTDTLGSTVTVNNSLAKIHAGGACQLDDGEVKYL